MPSVMSFASSSGAPIERVFIPPDKSMRSSQQLEAKVDMVYSLLSMLGGQEHADMGETLFALSTNPESCLAMRESGWLIFLAIAKINLFFVHFGDNFIKYFQMYFDISSISFDIQSSFFFRLCPLASTISSV